MPPEQNLSQEENPELQLKQIRTYQGDVAQALKSQQESLVSIQRAEHVRRGPTDTPQEIAERKKRRQFVSLLFGSILLFVIGGAGAWWGYTEFVRRTISPIIQGPANRFVSINSSKDIDLTDISRQAIVTNFAGTGLDVADEQLEQVIFRKTVGTEKQNLSTSELFEILDTGASGSLVRAFDPLFMLGVVGESSTTTRPSTFLIIKIASYENAFAGMLNWEGTLARDLAPLLSTNAELTTLPVGTPFTDLTDRNKDIRVLGLPGQPLLLYTFFENNLLIITDQLETIQTLIERLTREKLSR